MGTANVENYINMIDLLFVFDYTVLSPHIKNLSLLFARGTDNLKKVYKYGRNKERYLKG